MVSRTILGLALAMVALPTAAANAGSFAGTLGVKVPRGAVAEVRAIDRASGTVAAVDGVGRNGRFSLKLGNGVYLVVGTVATTTGRLIQKDIGVSLKAGQKRRGAKLTARPRKRRPKASAAFVQEKGQVTPGRIAVEIPNVTGKTGDPDWDAMAGGINDLMINDILNASGDCGTAIIEVERRDELIKELEFQQSIYVDPSTRVVRNFILGDVELRGTIAAAPGGDAKVTIATIDKASGKELGNRSAVIGGNAVFDQLEALARQVAEDLCNLSDVYEVTLDVAGEGRFATHSAAGAMHAVLRARRSERGRAVWRATGPLAWQGLTFASNIPECSYVDPIAPQTSWTVTILDAGDGQLAVTWQLGSSDATTVSVDCTGDPDPPPIAGQPGVALVNTGPGAFYVPYAGGLQAISGVLEDGGDGYFNSGTIKVDPAGIG